MFCNHCGQSLQGDARFCAGCGTPSPSASAAPAPPPAPQAQWSAPPAQAQWNAPPVQGQGNPLHAQTQWAAPPAQAQWGAPAAPQQWQAAPPPLGQSPTSHAAPPAARQSSLHWLVIGPIIIAALQAATFYGGVKYYESSVKSPEQVHEVAMRIALASMTLPYLFGGWLIAYRSVGRTILLAAVAAVLSVGVMYLIVPYTGLDLKLDRDGLLGASIIGFVCAFVGAVIGEFTPGHR